MLVLLQSDPTGLTTPFGRLVMAAGLLVVIALAIRFLWDHRNKR
ncbi:hypothetical protein [Saccharopolyspora montiporae]|nr:hypothetical protein [Saccharopolyspora sp. HNM0983]